MKPPAIFILQLSSFSLIFAGGCHSGSADRIAMLENAIGQINTASAELDSRIADVNDLVAATAAVLQDPNIPDEAIHQIGDKLAQAQQQARDLLAAKAQVDAVLQDLQSRLAAVQAKGDVDLSDELKVAAATLTATGQAVGGKTSVYLALAGSIVGALAGFVPANRKANTLQAKYTSHKQGIETTLNDPAMDASDAKLLGSKLYQNIGAARARNGVT